MRKNFRFKPERQLCGFVLAILCILILSDGCKRVSETSMGAMLDRIESKMFQEPESLDSLLGQLDTIHITPLERARINTIRGVIQYDKGEIEKCISYLEKAETVYLSQEDRYHSTINKLVRAIIFEHLQLADNATRLYIECEEYFARHGHEKFKFYASLALLRMSDQLALDRESLFKGLRQKTEELRDPVYRALLYAAMGASAENDSIKISYYEKAKADFIEAQRWSGAYTAELNILYSKIRQDPSRRTQAYYDRFPDKPYRYTPTSEQYLRYRYAQGYLFAKQGKDMKAIEVIGQVLDDAAEMKIQPVEANCVELLSVLYKHIGDYKYAQQMLERYNGLKANEREAMRRYQVLALGAYYRYTELEQEKLDLRLQVQRFLFIMVVMGLIFVTAFLIAWILLRESRHRQTILKLKNIEVEEQIANLLQSLKAEREKKTDLIRQVQDLQVQYQDASLSSGLLKAIDQKQITTWIEYEVAFQRLRPGWIERLKQQIPELSPTDMKYCMCLYFNLTNYAITNLLGVGDEAVKSAKKRIRNKFSLDESTEIYLYLKKID